MCGLKRGKRVNQLYEDIQYLIKALLGFWKVSSVGGDVEPPAALAFDVPLRTLVTFQAEDVHCWGDFSCLGRCQGLAWQLIQVPVVPESGLESGSVLQARWPFHMAAYPAPIEHFRKPGKLQGERKQTIVSLKRCFSPTVESLTHNCPNSSHSVTWFQIVVIF